MHPVDHDCETSDTRHSQQWCDATICDEIAMPVNLCHPSGWIRQRAKIGPWSIALAICARAQPTRGPTLRIGELKEFYEIIKIADIPPHKCTKTFCQLLYFMCQAIPFGILGSHVLLQLPFRSLSCGLDHDSILCVQRQIACSTH